MGGGALAQRTDRATHDWASNRAGAAPDRWADVKTPGNGWTFSVGTTLAPTSDPASVPSPEFSEASVSGPTPFRTGTSQVVILQARNPSGAVSWQRYFYGRTSGQNNGLSLFARAVSVYLPQWDGATQADWRIAICGESFDGTLPNTTLPNPQGGDSITAQQTLFPSGFVAVYKGNGDLLWSHHFFPPASAPALGYVGTTAITDVAIHVEGDSEAALDVVTYCGFTDTGNYLGSNNQFDQGAVTTTCGLVTYTGGIGFAPPTGQTDGFVGRLTCPHNGTPSQVQRPFQSFVGSTGNDQLSAIAEITEDRFAVVGSVSLDGSSAVPPVASANCITGVIGTFGYIAVFNAVLVRADPVNGVLLLEQAEVIGTPAPGGSYFTTTTRDVAVVGEHVCVVGETNNPALPNAQNILINAMPPATTRAGVIFQGLGPSSGGLVDSTYYVQPYGTLECELVGIGAWSEHADHLYVVGSVQKLATATLPLRRHGFVSSLFRDTPTSLLSRTLLLIREWGIDDLVTSSFFPAGTSGGMANSGWPMSGGIAVDERSIITVVGSTSGGTDFPIYPPGGAGILARELGQNVADDGVAVRIDMLPPGARRSDGTGDPFSAWSPPTTFDGGTTPVCARAVYGQSIGVTPPLPRMLIDLEGTPGAGNVVSVLIDRPPATNGQYSFGFLRIGFPNPTPDPALLTTYGIEFWLDATDWLLAPQTVTGGSLRDPLFGPGGLPLGSYGFSVQFGTLMTQGFAGCPTSFIVAASPALYFDY